MRYNGRGSAAGASIPEFDGPANHAAPAPGEGAALLGPICRDAVGLYLAVQLALLVLPADPPGWGLFLLLGVLAAALEVGLTAARRPRRRPRARPWSRRG